MLGEYTLNDCHLIHAISKAYIDPFHFFICDSSSWTNLQSDRFKSSLTVVNSLALALGIILFTTLDITEVEVFSAVCLSASINPRTYLSFLLSHSN